MAEGKKRARIDWEAVERDYRTAAFTLRELAAKHGGSHQAIAKQVKNKGWTQDLSKAVRAATNARVIEETVAKKVAASGQAVANTVIAVAEANAKVILRHQGLLDSLADEVDNFKAKLQVLADGVADPRELVLLIGALESLARTSKNVIEKQAQVHKLYQGDDKPDADAAENLTDDALQAKIDRLLGNVEPR